MNSIGNILSVLTELQHIRDGVLQSSSVCTAKRAVSLVAVPKWGLKFQTDVIGSRQQTAPSS